MGDPPPFPLFWLPFLAFINVIRLMNIREQFKFGKISRRASQEVGNSVRRGTVQLGVRFRETYVLIHLENETMKNGFEYRIWPQIPESYPSMNSIKEHIKYLKYIFNLDAIRLYFMKDNLADVRKLISFIKGENLGIKHLFCENDLSDESYVFLMKECSDCPKFCLLSSPASKNFQLDASECPKFNSEDITITNSKWMTIKHLEECFMNCKTLWLKDSLFTPKDLNSFLKRWIQGSKIDDASIDLKTSSNFRSIVLGITATPIRGAQNKYSRFPHKFKDGHCFLIKNLDGKKALVYKPDQIDCMTLTTDFSLDTKIESREEYKKRVQLRRSSGKNINYEMDDDEKTDVDSDEDSDDDFFNSDKDTPVEEDSEDDESEEEEDSDEDTDE